MGNHVISVTKAARCQFSASRRKTEYLRTTSGAFIVLNDDAYRGPLEGVIRTRT
jgi:hypothetical protein